MFTGVYMSAWEQKSGEQKVLRGTKVHLGTKVWGTKVSGKKVLFHWAEIQKSRNKSLEIKSPGNESPSAD